MDKNQIIQKYKLVSIEQLYKSSFKILLDNIVVCIANTFILIVTCFLFGITIIGLLYNLYSIGYYETIRRGYI